MPGFVATDALETNLLAGATLNAAGTTNSTVVDLQRPGEVVLVLTTSTVTGTTPTIRCVVSEADDAAMSVNVRVLPAIEILTGTGAAQSNVTKAIDTQIYGRYIRVSVVAGGTSPVYTGSTLVARAQNYFRSPTFPTL